MIELAEWLVHIERLAETLYRGSSVLFREDRELSGFLQQLAEEEAQHGHMLGDVVAYARTNRVGPASIVLDAATRSRIEAPFLDCGSRLNTDSLKREHLIHCLVSAEYSEWNDIFLYVLSAVKDAGREFALTASIMQKHRQHIERFIETLPESKAYVAIMRRLPTIWQPRILIVEDYENVRDFLNAVLSTEAVVETAVNGKEALEKVRQQYFDVIISDVDMPVMDGLRFFSAASEIDPRIGSRFLYLTGNPTVETREFIRKNRLRYLEKPMQISELYQAVERLLDGRPKPGGRKKE